MWRPWWRHLGYVLQVWRHLGVQIWCAVIRHLGSISEVFEHGWVAHLSASDPPGIGPSIYRAVTNILNHFIILISSFCYHLKQALVGYLEPSVTKCTLMQWFKEVGFSTLYGALLLKTWRWVVISLWTRSETPFMFASNFFNFNKMFTLFKYKLLVAGPFSFVCDLNSILIFFFILTSKWLCPAAHTHNWATC